MKNLLVKAAICMASLAFVAACSNKRPADIISMGSLTLRIQPYNSVTQEDAEHLLTRIRPHLDSIVSRDVEYEILPVVKLPDSLKVGGKYNALKILQYERTVKGRSVIIGYTHDDIATEAHGHKNWGVFGLAFKGLDVAVVSDKRIKGDNLWKVAEHEFIHAYFNAEHCPDDNPHCIMRDAKGKNPIPHETGLCETCRGMLHR